jgi:hypothetical protein
VIEQVALSDQTGIVELHMPVVEGLTITGCSTISPGASSTYPGHRTVEVPMARLDDLYMGQAGFIKIDVEGHTGSARRCAADNSPLLAARTSGDRRALVARGARARAPISTAWAIAAISFMRAAWSQLSTSRPIACSNPRICPTSLRPYSSARGLPATSTTSSSCHQTNQP